MKRVWKPLDVRDGYRLYEVIQTFPDHPDWTERFIVAAYKPLHAVALLKQTHEGCNWKVEPVYFGKALDILMPEHWWTGADDD